MSYSVDFKALGELWNSLSKAVPGAFYGSVGHIKRSCQQDWANFHRSRAWQIILIFNTVYMCMYIVFIQLQLPYMYPRTAIKL